MFQELRKMRMRLNLYYMFVLILFISLFAGFVFYHLFSFSGFMLDRDLKGKAAQVNDLHTLPDLNDIPPDKRRPPRDEKNPDSLFKAIIYDKNINITKSSVQYQAIFQRSQELARQSWLSQKERWDTVNLNGIDYRIFTTPFHNNGDNGVVQTYYNLTIIHQLTRNFTQFLLAIGMVAIILAALLGWWLAGRAMIPVRLAWQQQKEFIADVSHELRTPLTVIQSNLDVALSDRSGTIEDNANWLQNAYSETMNMSKLVNNLLLLARIDAREIKFVHSDFDLSSLLCLASRKCNKRQKINAAPGMGLLFNFGMLQSIAFAAEN